MGKKRNAQNKQQLQNNNQVQKGQQIDKNILQSICTGPFVQSSYILLERDRYVSLLSENEGLRKEITRLTDNEKKILDIINKK